MATPITRVSFEGNDYLWDGRKWTCAKDCMVAPTAIVGALNALLPPGTLRRVTPRRILSSDFEPAVPASAVVPPLRSDAPTGRDADWVAAIEGASRGSPESLLALVSPRRVDAGAFSKFACPWGDHAMGSSLMSLSQPTGLVALFAHLGNGCSGCPEEIQVEAREAACRILGDLKEDLNAKKKRADFWRRLRGR